MKKIMILGAGTMALDLAQICRQGNYDVTIWVQDLERVEKGKTRLNNNLFRQVFKEKLTEAQKNHLLTTIPFTTDLREAKDQDLILEAVVENMEVKQNLLKELDQIAPEHCIFATNTSSLSISALASSCLRSDKVIGVHFFNPAQVMTLVELVRGLPTSDYTLATMRKFCESLKKEGVEVNETPGFVVNRLLIPMINDAINLLESGVSTPEGIDTCMKLGANHPMGPLALADFIGLDVCLAIMETLFADTGDARYRPALLLRKMVAGKQLGKKTKHGFYVY